MFALIGLFCLLAAGNVLFRFFDHDEFEHVHSTWYITQGALPYVDLYQGHNPLYWLTLSPVLLLGGERVASLFLLRMVNLIFVFGSAFFIWKLSRLLTGSREIAYLSALFLLFPAPFYPKKH